jgi:hypothetical protein
MPDTFTVGATTASFDVLDAPGNRRERSRDAEIAVRHVPGGEVVFVDVGGLQPRRWDLELLHATPADYDALEDLVGQRGTFVWAEGSFDALLLGPVAQTRVYPGGQSESRVSFLRLGDVTP